MVSYPNNHFFKDNIIPGFMLRLLLFSAVMGYFGTLYPTRWWVLKKLSYPASHDRFQYFRILPLSLRISSGIIGGIAGGILMSEVIGRDFFNGNLFRFELVFICLSSIISGKVFTEFINIIHNALE